MRERETEGRDTRSRREDTREEEEEEEEDDTEREGETQRRLTPSIRHSQQRDLSDLTRHVPFPMMIQIE